MLDHSGTHPGHLSVHAATLAGAAAIALWAWSGVCYAVGARAIGAMPYLALTSLVGVITILVMRLVRRQPVRPLFLIPLRVAVAGFFGVAAYSVMLAQAMGCAADAELGQVMLLNYLWPIWIVLLSMAMLDASIRAAWVLLGAALGFGGVIVARGLDSFLHRPESLLPHALALAGGFLWALYSVSLRRWRIPPEHGGSTFHFLICALLASTVGLATGQWAGFANLNAHAIFWVLFGGIGPVGLAYYWWELAIKRGLVHLIAVLAYAIPILSAVLIGLFFHEAMSRSLILGAAMIVAGAWISGTAGASGNRGDISKSHVQR